MATASFFVFVNPSEAEVVPGPPGSVQVVPGGASVDYTITLTNPNSFDAVSVAALAIPGAPSSPVAPVGVCVVLRALIGPCVPPDWKLDPPPSGAGGGAQGGAPAVGPAAVLPCP